MEVLVCLFVFVLKLSVLFCQNNFKLRVDSSPLVFQLHSCIGKEEVG